MRWGKVAKIERVGVSKLARKGRAVRSVGGSIGIDRGALRLAGASVVALASRCASSCRPSHSRTVVRLVSFEATLRVVHRVTWPVASVFVSFRCVTVSVYCSSCAFPCYFWKYFGRRSRTTVAPDRDTSRTYRQRRDGTMHGSLGRDDV